MPTQVKVRTAPVACNPYSCHLMQVHPNVITKHDKYTALATRLLFTHILEHWLPGPTKNKVEPRLSKLPNVYKTANTCNFLQNTNATTLDKVPIARQMPKPASR